MTDAEIIQAVAGWDHDGITYGVQVGAIHVRFEARSGGAFAGATLDRGKLLQMTPAGFDAVRIALDFGLSTCRASVEIAGGFSRS